MTHYVIRAIRYPEQGGDPHEAIFAELVDGYARLGWSSTDEQDLREIRDAETDERALSADQKDAKRGLPFLTDVRARDVLWYPHIPERNRVTAVRVTGDYGYDAGFEWVNRGAPMSDFRSFRPCRPLAWDLSMDGPIIDGTVRKRLRTGRHRISRVHESVTAFNRCLDVVAIMRLPNLDEAAVRRGFGR